MSKEDRRKLTESIAEKFTRLDEIGQAFIAGYITGKCEDHQHLERGEEKVPVA